MMEIASSVYRKPARRVGGVLRKTLLLVLLATWLPSVVSAATIILVRHADRSATMSTDALLSPAGDSRVPKDVSIIATVSAITAAAAGKSMRA